MVEWEWNNTAKYVLVDACWWDGSLRGSFISYAKKKFFKPYSGRGNL